MTPAARPILKWAGGKRQLLPQLRRFVPPVFDTYVEPFLGSAAMFLDLAASGALHGRAVCLSDGNADVIGCYRAVRDEVEAVVDALEALAARHRADPEQCFYAVRDSEFNTQRRELEVGPRRAAAYTPVLAAQLIYLNRTCFNGLFRLNRRGDFNVPRGRYSAPRIVDPDNLRGVSAAFGRRGTSLRAAPFTRTMAKAGAGSFVYLDPPYVPLSATARFTAYTADGFSESDQARLYEEILRLVARGGHVVLSNSDAPAVRALYTSAEAKAAGLRVHRIPARRSINARADRRGAVTELLVSNVRPRRA